MKIHTNDFKNELIKFGREIDCIISYELNGETIELGSSELNSITPHYEGSILKSVMKQLDIESNVEIPKETVLNCQFGLKVNGEYEYLNFGNYVVYDVEKQEDTRDYKITCYDKILYSMKSYESMNISYPITVRNYINQICNKLGLMFRNINDEFANYDKEITTELYLDSEGNDLGYTFRDVLDELAQATASTICINESTDELEIRYINNTNDSIDEYYLKDVNVKFGEKYGPINSIVLSRASDSDNVYLQDEDSIATNGLCEIKIKDNQIMNFNNRSDYLPDILEKLDGLEYYLNDFSSTGIAYYNLCDRYNIRIDNNTYSCIMFNDEFKITQGLEEIIHTELPEESETDYTKADKTDRKINQTYIIVDKQNQTIQSLVSEVGDYSDRISTVEQDVESISQSIRDFEDLVRENTGRERVFVENAMAGTIQYLSITGKFELLYPDEDIYPEDDIYPLEPYLIVENIPNEGEELQRRIYILPFDKLEVGEKFEIDETGKCTLTKQDESIEDLGALNVELYEGDNYVYITSNHPELLNYHVNFIIKNDYTDMFVTHVEMNSAITQTADEINLEVSKKVGEDEVISAINLSSEEAQINADKISLKGKTIQLTSDNIAINSRYLQIDKYGNITASKGTFSGAVITDENLTVGRNIYLAMDSTYRKNIYLSNNSVISRLVNAGPYDEAIEIKSADIHLVSGTGSISVNPDNAFVQSGNVYLRGDNNVYSNKQITITSDERLKGNIKNISVDWINDLKVKEFEYKDDNGRKQIGLIAQEYLDKGYSKYFLNDFDLNGEKYYGISYGNITNALIQYCQEMKEKINKLEKRIEELESDK